MRGESLTTTRHGRPVARLVPVEDDDRDRALRASRRILERRSHLARRHGLDAVSGNGNGLRLGEACGRRPNLTACSGTSGILPIVPPSIAVSGSPISGPLADRAGDGAGAGSARGD